jgi:ATP-dependent helicase/nuclease subunit A
MPGGSKRKANLNLLLDRAVSYEQTSYTGLFNFVRYISRLKKQEIDFSEGSISSEKDDVVRIMTIHKSKGLEFPVVFLAGLERLLNSKDTTDSVILHGDLGIGVHQIDTVERIKEKTIFREAISTQIKKENLGEELRILYVALTRAKRKADTDRTCKKP